MIVAMTRKPDTAGQQSEDVKNGVAQIPPEKHSRLLGRIGELARTCPKYVALSIALTEAFRDGTWKKGDKLPPEIDLASLTGLSLGTAQKAYSKLKEIDPELAGRFAYLDFRGDESARASDIEIIKETVLWEEEE